MITGLSCVYDHLFELSLWLLVQAVSMNVMYESDKQIY